jgi:AraC-like DNA-binding protein
VAIGFQEPAMDASTAKLMNFGARVLYLGPAFGLTPHRNATAVLAVALDGAIDVADDPGCSDSTYRTARSVLILPNRLHHLRIDGGRMAFLYVDPFGRDLAALRTRMREAGARADFDLIDEEKAVDLFKTIAGHAMTRDHARLSVSELLGVGSRAETDARILEAIRCMRDAPDRAHRLSELGKHAGLSPSRFLHLFKAETGVPLRRYRIWNRIGAASRAIAEGRSLTEAAHGAGFASSAHFSTAFRDMFGMMPSELFAALRTADPVQA